MRRRVIAGVALGAVAATAAAALVAQESQLPPVSAPPEEAAPPSEATPPPGPGATGVQTDSSGLPTAPVPYTVLVPQARRPQNQAQAQTDTTATLTPTPLELQDPGDLPPQKPRPRHSAAIVQAVDKVTAETMKFEVKVGRPVRYKTLIVTLRACETEAEDEPVRESAGHLTITSQPKAQPGRVQPEPAQVFRGWMFGSSPGLNPFEHPIYDMWLVGCVVPPPPPMAVAAAAPPTASAETPRRSPRPGAPAPVPDPELEDGEAPPPQPVARAPASGPG